MTLSFRDAAVGRPAMEFDVGAKLDDSSYTTVAFDLGGHFDLFRASQ